jgi:preprotein translocase subunit SecD
MARNEPVTFAVRKAIEAGVAEIIQQGANKELWKIKLPPEPVIVEESDAEVVTEEEVKVDLTVTQGKPEKIKKRAEYLAEKAAKKLAEKEAKELKKELLLEEKKAKKEKKLADAKAKKELLLAEKKAKKELVLAKKAEKKAQKIELATYNKENNTDFKTYSAYLKHLEKLKKALEKDAAILLDETESRKLRKEQYQANIVALEVEDESVIIDTNTVTSDND